MQRDNVEFSVASLEKVDGTLGHSGCLLVYGGLERPGHLSSLCEYDVVGNAERLTDIMKLSCYLSINYVRLNTNSTLRQYIHCHNI